jgi:hypothetical protein
VSLAAARRRQGQVISISPTPTPTVEVTIGGDPSVTVFVPYLDSYVPTVNDYVMLLEDDGDYLCLGSSTPGAASAGVNYTPTWRTTGTQPTMGSATLTGRYFMLGPKFCQFRVHLVIGSGTGGGTGTYSFDLPFTATTVAVPQFVQFRIATNAGADNFVGFGFIPSGVTAANMYAVDSTASPPLAVLVAAAAPVLNVGSQLSLWGVYEIA